MQAQCIHCLADGHPPGARYCAMCGRPLAGAAMRPESLVHSATRMTPLLQRWRKLSTRMTRNDVRALLGEPARLSQAGPDEEWLYLYFTPAHPETRIAGTVRILRDEARLSTWTEPDWDAFADKPVA